MAFTPNISDAAEVKTDKFSHGLFSRNYDYYVPDSATRNSPVLMVFHGLSADKHRLWRDTTKLENLYSLADKEGFIVMWMESTQLPDLPFGRSWNGGVCCSRSVAFK